MLRRQYFRLTKSHGKNNFFGKRTPYHPRTEGDDDKFTAQAAAPPQYTDEELKARLGNSPMSAEEILEKVDKDVGPKDRYDTVVGKFATRHPRHPDARPKPGEGYKAPERTVEPKEFMLQTPYWEGHHPYISYQRDTPNVSNYDEMGLMHNWDLKKATMSLYRCCLIAIPLVKHYYGINLDFENMKRRIRERFEANRNVNDPEAIRHLLHIGFREYHDAVGFRKTSSGVQWYFHYQENLSEGIKEFANEEKSLMQMRAHWNGEEQKAEGPYNGFWSYSGQQNHEEFQKLKGRTPISWTASKGYFELWRCDGTNFWEKNMDYEGWAVRNVDPDKAAARKDLQAQIEAAHTNPKHYTSKNRRTYRRMIREIENMLTASTHELYAASRELNFQAFIREDQPETNRIYAEKRLAQMDDEVFTTKVEEHDAIVRQVMREMPNPRQWKTDAFYLRVRHRMQKLDFNWARAPIGVDLEKGFNTWVSDDVNYAVMHSKAYEELKACKKRNPMARTWADFYQNYDPDVPETRRLPWYHSDFDYDRRYKWDERCMRMKKWADSGEYDIKRPFFEAQVHKDQQFVNRPEVLREYNSLDAKYGAPRRVQMYRSFMRRMDIALANQMKEALGDGVNAQNVEQKIKAHDWSKFAFDVPPVIYPDGVEQPPLDIDGRPKATA